LIKVDFLSSVNFDEDALATLVFPNMNSRTLACHNADPLFRVHLLFGADIKKLSCDLSLLALELCAVEDVVEEHFLETDGISRVVGGNCNRLTRFALFGLCGCLFDPLRTHQLCAEDHLLAHFR